MAVWPLKMLFEAQKLQDGRSLIMPAEASASCYWNHDADGVKGM